MKTNEREQQIITLLRERSFISVQELAALLFTSPSSIRRDLTRLEALGVVKRNYGGVVAAGGNPTAPPIAIRSEINRSAKRAIAKKASILLRDDQSILLDDSTTAAAMVEFIGERKGMTVFTNNIETANLSTEKGIRTYLLGGALPADSATVTTGKFALDMLRSIHTDLCFFSGSALSDAGEIFDSTESHNLLRREMLCRASVRCFLCDSSKFSRTSLYRSTTLCDIDYICTDAPLPDGISTGKAKCL
ncbi:MAG: DeoR/GlpR transcriptional regulator [Clostridia bacterium]|nr:DeoR/GlpR transcriptional regulator [Clostridia bacterium]